MRLFLAAGAAAVILLLFLAAGYVFVRHAGAQEDEALFAAGNLEPADAYVWLELATKRIPVMVRAHLGGLKAMLYRPWFRARPPDVRSLRLPVLCLGALTLALYFALFMLTLGSARTLIALSLIAADPIFLLTTVHDYGPVAIQRFLSATAMLLFVLFHRYERYRFLAGACIACGLALWDNLSFVWVLVALAAGLAAGYRRQIRHHVDWRMAAFLALWISLGAMPLIYANLRIPGLSLRATAGERPPPAARARLMAKTLDGSLLFGWYARTADGGGRESPGETRIERMGVAMSDFAGRRESHIVGWALAGAAIALPWLWRTPAGPVLRFGFAGLAAGWLAALLIPLGSRGAPHLGLLSPLPQMLLAAAIWELAARAGRGRPLAAAAAVVILAASCASVTIEYYARIVRLGPGDEWSGAVHRLRAHLADTPTGAIFTADRGILAPLRLLGRGALPLKPAPWQSPRRLTSRDRDEIRAALSVPEFLYVRYADRRDKHDLGYERLLVLAREDGFREELVTVIHDSHGRAVYRITRFVPAS